MSLIEIDSATGREDVNLVARHVGSFDRADTFKQRSADYGSDRLSFFDTLGRQVGAKLAFIMALVDLFAIVAGFGAAALIADGIRVALGYDALSFSGFLLTRGKECALLAGLTIGVFAFGGLYRRSGWEVDEIRRIVAGVALVALFDAAIQFIARDHDSRLWFMAAYPMVAVAIVGARMAVRSLPSMADAMTTHVIMLGGGKSAKELMYEMRGSRSGPVRLLRSLSFEEIQGRNPHTLVRMIDRLARNAGVPSHRVQIMLVPSSAEIDQAQETVELLNQTSRPFSIVLPFTGLARNGMSLRKAVGADTITAEVHPIAPPVLLRASKRAFDLVLGTICVILLAPLLAGVTLLLMREGGPVFFSQIRVGRDGRRFRCFKFRTMLPDAEERLRTLLATNPAARDEWAKFQKLQNDPRITRVGNFLRKTSLDELPQLINVLKGEMSLVGPRPIIAPEIQGYASDKAYFDSADFRYYASCTPGITGLWQVSGRASTSHDERVRLDRWYARNLCFWLDVMIIFKTIRTVLVRQGSV